MQNTANELMRLSRAHALYLYLCLSLPPHLSAFIDIFSDSPLVEVITLSVVRVARHFPDAEFHVVRLRLKWPGKDFAGCTVLAANGPGFSM